MGHRATISDAAFSPNGSRLISVDVSGKVLMWNVAMRANPTWARPWVGGEIGTQTKSWTIKSYTETIDKSGQYSLVTLSNENDKAHTFRLEEVFTRGKNPPYTLKTREITQAETSEPASP